MLIASLSFEVRPDKRAEFVSARDVCGVDWMASGRRSDASAAETVTATEGKCSAPEVTGRSVRL